MRLYDRKDFILLPPGTIYSKIDPNSSELMDGLYCKTSGDDWLPDWVEQKLIGECGFPNGIKDGLDAIQYQLDLRDTYQQFRQDLNCAGRDGCFDDSDKFVVWDKQDVKDLINFLQDSISNLP